ncbi:hypothetical protein CB452P1_000044 [Clostridium phage CB452P1]|nr:hypothetical protein CB452P1_000044 [Clostridium phage CB452P1]
MDKIRIKVSEKAYKEKPTPEDMKHIFYSYLKDSSNKEVTYEELAVLLEQGHSVTLADYKTGCNSIKEEYIQSISCIALDVDGKENKINIHEMVGLIYKKFGMLPIIKYCTFSDTDNTRFRLIYRFEDKIDIEVYKSFYIALQWKLNKYIDQQTKNANRSWAGTNKKVEYCDNDIPFSFAIIVKLIHAYNSKLKREAEKNKIEFKGKCNNEFTTESYIKTEYKEDVIKFLIQNIDLRDFITSHFSWKYKRNGDNLVGPCFFHGGDNQGALVVSKTIYTCFTRCGTGNVITAARKAYGIEHFSTVAFRLCQEYNLTIPEEFIKER